MKHKKKLIKRAKARVTGTIPYCHGKVPHSRKLLSPCSNDLKKKTPLKSLEHGLSNFLEWGTLPWQYGIVPVTLALALLINLFLCFMD
jgi:hypothetical protein